MEGIINCTLQFGYDILVYKKYDPILSTYDLFSSSSWLQNIQVPLKDLSGFWGWSCWLCLWSCCSLSDAFSWFCP